jgi:single-strand DNA-binding protein
MNKIILIGNLTRDIETATTKNGKEYCIFSIAVDRHKKDADGVNITDFFDVIAGGAIVPALARYGKKGKKIGVTGVMTQKSVKDKNGKARIFYTVYGETFDFLTPRTEETAKTGEPKKMDYDDSDVPF